MADPRYSPALDAAVVLFLDIEAHRNDCFWCRKSLLAVDQLLNGLDGRTDVPVTPDLEARVKAASKDMCPVGAVLMKRFGEVGMEAARVNENQR